MVYPKSTNMNSKISKIPTNNGKEHPAQKFDFLFLSGDEFLFCHNIKVFISKTCQNNVSDSLLITTFSSFQHGIVHVVAILI